MKYVYTILIFLFLAPVCFAKSQWGDVHNGDIFIIKYVNAPEHKINIGGKIKGKGKTFRANSIIKWENAGDYIRAENIRTEKKYKISSCAFKNHGAKDVANFIRKRYTADKGGDSKLYEKEGNYLSKFPFELIDGEIEIPVNLPLDDNHYYILKPIPWNNKDLIIADIDSEDGIIYITQSQLAKIGILPEELQNYSFIVQYIHDGISTTLTDNLKIQYIQTNNYLSK